MTVENKTPNRGQIAHHGISTPARLRTAKKTIVKMHPPVALRTGAPNTYSCCHDAWLEWQQSIPSPKRHPYTGCGALSRFTAPKDPKAAGNRSMGAAAEAAAPGHTGSNHQHTRKRAMYFVVALEHSSFPIPFIIHTLANAVQRARRLSFISHRGANLASSCFHLQTHTHTF